MLMKANLDYFPGVLMIKKFNPIVTILFISSIAYLPVNAQATITIYHKTMIDFNNGNDKNMATIKQLIRNNFEQLFIESDNQNQEKLIDSFCHLSLSRPDYYIVYACDDNDLAGCIIFHKTSAKGAIIDKGIVDEKFRNRGIGSRMMAYTVSLFEKMGVEQALFLTDESNVGVYKIGERYGFVCDEKKSLHFRGPYKRFRWKKS